jgi:hypothetical protein
VTALAADCPRSLEAVELRLENVNDRLEALHREIAEIHEALLAAKMKLVGDSAGRSAGSD